MPERYSNIHTSKAQQLPMHKVERHNRIQSAQGMLYLELSKIKLFPRRQILLLRNFLMCTMSMNLLTNSYSVNKITVSNKKNIQCRWKLSESGSKGVMLLV